MTTDPTPAEQLRRSIDLLWGPSERPARGPKPSLTLDRIVEAAIAAADRDGIGALSMRRVAGELGVGAMSLYRYVPGKAELLALMLDRLILPGEDVTQAADKGWRELLEAVARDSYRLYLRHPWLLRVNWTRPVMGPNSLAGVEIVIAGLAGLGLTDQEQIGVVITLDGFVTGFVRQRILYDAAAEETGVSDEEFWSQHHPVLVRAMESGNYPAMAALSAEAYDASWDESFDFGLDRLLDGFAVLFAARRGIPPPGPGETRAEDQGGA
ncbi:TetR/AcrR family transcriptional regulator [Actinopolymorpha alba]|uniref:TetR/AcrR family transcriptional regulator n=1 Tax=Actinopolymorpha alba TaxID=533267 RepID=UPI00036A3065|nr:TetR/AcrR family transcriptional regulator [Actinopolymorpha alba]